MYARLIEGAEAAVTGKKSIANLTDEIRCWHWTRPDSPTVFFPHPNPHTTRYDPPLHLQLNANAPNARGLLFVASAFLLA